MSDEQSTMNEPEEVPVAEVGTPDPDLMLFTPQDWELQSTFKRVRAMFRDGASWTQGQAEHVGCDGVAMWCLGGAIGRAVTHNPNAMDHDATHPDTALYLPYANAAGRVLAKARGADFDEGPTDIRVDSFTGQRHYPYVSALIHWNDEQPSFTQVGRLVNALANGVEFRLVDEPSTEDTEQQPETD